MDQQGREWRLSDLRGKVVVLYFYPKDFTSGCTQEACDFRDRYGELAGSGAVVLGVSPDGSQSHKRFAMGLGLPFQLLSDETHQTMSLYGAWGKKRQYGRECEGVIRSTFIIDRQGQITHAWPAVKVDGHAAKVLAEVKKLTG
jgi:peroxiredoxin Q/BCP